ncbi:hypothetical protein ENBRE01_0200 [Enteropsectra breve]|nr:hypothetical protein ENBRE01_0200 [Enteropsectra breve]
MLSKSKFISKLKKPWKKENEDPIPKKNLPTQGFIKTYIGKIPRLRRKSKKPESSESNLIIIERANGSQKEVKLEDYVGKTNENEDFGKMCIPIDVSETPLAKEDVTTVPVELQPILVSGYKENDASGQDEYQEASDSSRSCNESNYDFEEKDTEITNLEEPVNVDSPKETLKKGFFRNLLSILFCNTCFN